MENKIKKTYCVGIGGIGMSALAQMLVRDGALVSGSDRSASPTTELLEREEIMVHIGHSADNVPEDTDTLVYSDAVPEDNPERVRAVELGITQFSYFQMLGKVSAGKRTVAVAGTHGKTTTTAMLAKVLIYAGASPNVVVGSIVRDFDNNYVRGTSDLFVVEACEYREHLLQLTPEILVINNLEWDHTDYFQSLEALQETFRKAIMNVPKNGAIITNPADKNILPLLGATTARVIDYTKETVPQLQTLGEFNAMNARAAAAAARVAYPDISQEVINTSLTSFKGVWRRFEYKGKTKNGVVVYDDYAHHPTEVHATLDALRAKTQGKLFVVFQPHLFSRTRDLLDDFAKAFVGADGVVIAPIYAARENDDGTISNHTLAKRINETGVKAHAIDSFDAIKKFLEQHTHSGDTIITMGAGDVYSIAEHLVIG